jgi:hypothetical protein
MALSTFGISPSKLGKKVPLSKKTDDTTSHFMADNQRAAFIDVCDILTARPTYRTQSRDFLVGLLRAETKASVAKSDASFEDGPPTLGQVDPTWMAGYIVSRSKLTLEELGKIKAFSSANIRNLYLYDQNANAGCKNPADCISKSVLQKSNTARSLAMGSRLSNLAFDGSLIDTSGKVNWASFGEYGFDTDDGHFITHVIHKATNAKVSVEAEGMTDDFELCFNWNALQASLKKGSRTHVINKFFEKACGPHAQKPLSGKSLVWEGIVATAVKQLKADKETLASSVVAEDTETLSKAAKTKAREATKNARAILEQKKEDNAKKRRLTVAAAKPPGTPI